jgi:prephenate dehydrogenase
VVDAGAQIENLSDADFVILSVPVDVALICCQSFDDVGENSIVLR